MTTDIMSNRNEMDLDYVQEAEKKKTKRKSLFKRRRKRNVRSVSSSRFASKLPQSSSGAVDSSKIETVDLTDDDNEEKKEKKKNLSRHIRLLKKNFDAFQETIDDGDDNDMVSYDNDRLIQMLSVINDKTIKSRSILYYPRRKQCINNPCSCIPNSRSDDISSQVRCCILTYTQFKEFVGTQISNIDETNMVVSCSCGGHWSHDSFYIIAHINRDKKIVNYLQSLFDAATAVSIDGDQVTNKSDGLFVFGKSDSQTEETKDAKSPSGCDDKNTSDTSSFDSGDSNKRKRSNSKEKDIEQYFSVLRPKKKKIRPQTPPPCVSAEETPTLLSPVIIDATIPSTDVIDTVQSTAIVSIGHSSLPTPTPPPPAVIQTLKLVKIKKQINTLNFPSWRYPGHPSLFMTDICRKSFEVPASYFADRYKNHHLSCLGNELCTLETQSIIDSDDHREEKIILKLSDTRFKMTGLRGELIIQRCNSGKLISIFFVKNVTIHITKRFESDSSYTVIDNLHTTISCCRKLNKGDVRQKGDDIEIDINGDNIAEIKTTDGIQIEGLHEEDSWIVGHTHKAIFCIDKANSILYSPNQISKRVEGLNGNMWSSLQKQSLGLSRSLLCDNKNVPATLPKSLMFLSIKEGMDSFREASNVYDNIQEKCINATSRFGANRTTTTLALPAPSTNDNTIGSLITQNVDFPNDWKLQTKGSMISLFKASEIIKGVKMLKGDDGKLGGLKSPSGNVITCRKSILGGVTMFDGRKPIALCKHDKLNNPRMIPFSYSYMTSMNALYKECQRMDPGNYEKFAENKWGMIVPFAHLKGDHCVTTDVDLYHYDDNNALVNYETREDFVTTREMDAKLYRLHKDGSKVVNRLLLDNKKLQAELDNINTRLDALKGQKNRNSIPTVSPHHVDVPVPIVDEERDIPKNIIQLRQDIDNVLDLSHSSTSPDSTTTTTTTTTSMETNIQIEAVALPNTQPQPPTEEQIFDTSPCDIFKYGHVVPNKELCDWMGKGNTLWYNYKELRNTRVLLVPRNGFTNLRYLFTCFAMLDQFEDVTGNINLVRIQEEIQKIAMEDGLHTQDIARFVTPDHKIHLLKTANISGGDNNNALELSKTLDECHLYNIKQIRLQWSLSFMMETSNTGSLPFDSYSPLKKGKLSWYNGFISRSVPVREWYPSDCGISPNVIFDLSIPVQPRGSSGQGHGKVCHYCNFHITKLGTGKAAECTHSAKTCPFLHEESYCYEDIIDRLLEMKKKPNGYLNTTTSNDPNGYRVGSAYYVLNTDKYMTRRKRNWLNYVARLATLLDPKHEEGKFTHMTSTFSPGAYGKEYQPGKKRKSSKESWIYSLLHGSINGDTYIPGHIDKVSDFIKMLKSRTFQPLLSRNAVPVERTIPATNVNDQNSSSSTTNTTTTSSPHMTPQILIMKQQLQQTQQELKNIQIRGQIQAQRIQAQQNEITQRKYNYESQQRKITEQQEELQKQKHMIEEFKHQQQFQQFQSYPDPGFFSHSDEYLNNMFDSI